jgi:hypothetical protein
MRAELVLMGKSIDMAPQVNRRALVMLIYVALGVLMAGLFLADHWRLSGYYLVLGTFVVNRLFLGGYNTGGLIKPFSGKAPRRTEMPPPFLLLALRVYPTLGVENDFRSDERELGQRDRAHYQAYQLLVMVLAVLWLLSGWRAFHPRMVEWMAGGVDLVIYGVVLGAIVAALTLPQAILLWTERDMEG